ncbi:MAG: ABC-F family ATP-binding cassette domain-containing protein [Clostridia bacterium]|nr:ABC-F family ATP-binding cassette domain-containing protein [Clostridia bacterium]
MILQVNNICKSFGTDIILEDINLKAEQGEKIGLIGANGAGKSTLLKIICGEIPYDSGSIIAAKDLRKGFLKQSDALDGSKTIWSEMIDVFSHIVDMEQEMRELENKMSDDAISDDERTKVLEIYGKRSESFEKAGGFELRAKILTVLNGMGFEGFNLNEKISNLSGGEKTKLAMAKLLLDEPDLLLLDEPTNHLDFKTMQWLEGYLKSYKKAVIVVSHDRYFLDSIADTIYEIERTKSTRYVGNYSKYLEQKEQNRDQQAKAYELQQKEIKRLEDYVARNIARASTSKSAKSKQKIIDKMEIVERPSSELKSCRFFFESAYSSFKDVLTAENLSVSVNDGGILKKLFSNVSFEIKRGEKVALIGANGIGKSTLLKTLLGIHKEYTGRFDFGKNVEIGYYDQEQKILDGSKTVLDAAWDLVPRMDESEVRTMLGSLLFTNEDVFKKIDSLSGGEKAKLEFLTISVKKPNTMILDEPTNHLDLPSKEALDVALKEYNGTVFFVSHDRYFLNKIADKIIELTETGVNIYVGNYDNYIEKKTAPAQTSNITLKSGINSYEEEKRAQALKKSLTKKLAKTEEDIAAAEERAQELSQLLEQTGADYEKAREIYDEIEKNNKLIEQLYEDWENYSEQLSTPDV